MCQIRPSPFLASLRRVPAKQTSATSDHLVGRSLIRAGRAQSFSPYPPASAAAAHPAASQGPGTPALPCSKSGVQVWMGVEVDLPWHVPGASMPALPDWNGDVS